MWTSAKHFFSNDKNTLACIYIYKQVFIGHFISITNDYDIYISRHVNLKNHLRTRQRKLFVSNAKLLLILWIVDVFVIVESIEKSHKNS